MENSTDKQITPNNNGSSHSSQRATPKNQAQAVSTPADGHSAHPISNIKQLTVHTELYPPSTQLIDQSAHANNQNSSQSHQNQSSTPQNAVSGPSKPPLPNLSQTPTHAQNKPPTPLPKEVSAGAASGQASTKNAPANLTQSNGFQRQSSQSSALGNDPVKLKERIAQLETKIKYYETEHTNYQNQLLSQRSQYEQESKRLKTQVEEMTKTLSALPKVNQQEADERTKQLEAEGEPSQEEILKENEALAQEYSSSVLSTVKTLNLKEQLAQLWQQNHEYEVKLKQVTDQLTVLTKENQQLNSKQALQPVTPDREINLQSLGSIVNIEFKGQAMAEQASEAMLKLQKKMIELERYLQDKDKVILEQENSLSELNDQNHELLKAEDSLQSALRVKHQTIEDLERQIRLHHEQQQLLLEDKDHQLRAKEKTLNDTIDLLTEKELEIQGMLRQVRDAEEAIKEYRARNQSLEQQYQQYQQQYGQMAEENEQIKSDMEAILSYKAEIEGVVEEQTQNIEVKNKRLAMTEETLRYREQELDKKEALLRRVTQGADENKKKLAQAEMKLRQITQTTLRDLKLKLKDKLNEIEVLKEMVKSANKQAKAKDIDIQRLSNRIHRLEKMTELGRGIIQDGNMALDTSNPIIEDDAELDETVKMSQPINLMGGANSFATPLKSQPPLPPYPRKVNQSGHDPLGLNPINYTKLAGGQRSVEDEVQMELLNNQQQRHYSIKQVNSHAIQAKNSLVNRSHVGASSGSQGVNNIRNLKQREIEEAMELDRMLEQERRNQSQDVFAKKYEQRFESYYNNLQNAHQTNMKNNSVGMKGVFGAPTTNQPDADDNPTQRNGNYDSLRYYDGMLPNLNLSKKEQLERELMAEINDSVAKKDKYHTPNIQAKSKIVNKAYGIGNQMGNNNYPNSAVRRQNNSKNRAQL